MGKKKNQQHVQQSMSQMISSAALSKMGPQIELFVRNVVQDMGNQIATQQASTLETIFSRVVILETIMCEKHGYTIEDLAKKVSELEDSRENLKEVDSVETNDLVRLEIKTKTKEQTEYQGSSKFKVYNTGKGSYLGLEIESKLIGMKTGEVKVFPFGENNGMEAQVTINRVSRSKETKPEASEVPSENSP